MGVLASSAIRDWLTLRARDLIHHSLSVAKLKFSFHYNITYFRALLLHISSELEFKIKLLLPAISIVTN